MMNLRWRWISSIILHSPDVFASCLVRIRSKDVIAPIMQLRPTSTEEDGRTQYGLCFTDILLHHHFYHTIILPYLLTDALPRLHDLTSTVVLFVRFFRRVPSWGFARKIACCTLVRGWVERQTPPYTPGCHAGRALSEGRAQYCFCGISSSYSYSWLRYVSTEEKRTIAIDGSEKYFLLLPFLI